MRYILIAITLSLYGLPAIADESTIHVTCNHLKTHGIITQGKNVKESTEAIRKIVLDYDGQKESGTLIVIRSNGKKESTEIANVYGSDESMYLTFVGGFDSYKQYLVSLMLEPEMMYFSSHNSIKTESDDIKTSAELSYGKCDIEMPDSKETIQSDDSSI